MKYDMCGRYDCCSSEDIIFALQHKAHEIDGWVQNGSISIANTLGILQSCTTPSITDAVCFGISWLLHCTVQNDMVYNP